MSIRVCIAGATGWTGSLLAVEVSKQPDLQIIGAVSRNSAGKRLKDIVPDCASGIVISGTVEEALQQPADVYVDYTSAEAVREHVLTAIRKGVYVVIGTSGLSDDDYAEISAQAVRNDVGVIAAGNFAITAVLLQRFAAEAAKFLSHWEIIDYASDTKIDAPSGVSRELAYRLSSVKRPEQTHSIEKTVGSKESRGATIHGMQIHSLRLPGFVIGLEVIFADLHERLTIRHDAGSSALPYIAGTLLAIRKVREYRGLIRGLENLLFQSTDSTTL